MGLIYNDFQAERARLDEADYRPTVGRSMDNDRYNRVAQVNFADALRAHTEGKGPSIAQSQFATAQDAAQKASASAIGSARGLNPAQQARMALDANAQMQQQAARGSAELRAQEMQAANQLYQQQLGQMQAGTQNLMQTAGGLQNQQNANRINETQGRNQINAKIEEGNTEVNRQLLGSGLGALGKIGGMAAGVPMAAGGFVMAPGAADPDRLPVPFAQAIAAGAMANGGRVTPRDFDKWTPEQKERLYRQNLEETNRRIRESAAADLRREQDEKFRDDSFKASHGRDPVRLGGLRLAEGGEVEAADKVPPSFAEAVANADRPVDDPDHDVVPAMLSPGEVVLPRSVVHGPNPDDRAAAFVAALKAQKEQEAQRSRPPPSYGDVVRMRRELDALKARLGGAA